LVCASYCEFDSYRKRARASGVCDGRTRPECAVECILGAGLGTWRYLRSAQFEPRPRELQSSGC